MKFPSIQEMIAEAIASAKRFPFVLLAALILEISMNIIIEDNFEDLEFFQKLAMCASLAIPFFFAIKMFSERFKLSFPIQSAINSGMALLLLAYYFTIDIVHLEYNFNYVALMIAAHLLVALSAYIKIDNSQGFWQFNKILLLRILTSAFFSLALFAGLSIAIVGTEKLLGVDWNRHIYGHLFALIAFIFNTWFFIAGIPKRLEEIDRADKYEKVIKLFAQFVLIPITSIYLLILYMYEIKIMLDWSLPKGWVSGLILAYATLGILANLLLFPLIRKEGKKWILIFTRSFYITLFPLIILLYLAISTRIAEYGYTEARYYGVILMGWLLLIAIYFVLSKKRNIKAIPYSLAFLAFATIFGPWSATSVSVSSQKARVLELFEEHELFVDGKLNKNLEITGKDWKEIENNVRFLKKRNEYDWVIDEINQRGDLALVADSISTFYIDDSLGVVFKKVESQVVGARLKDSERVFNVNIKTSFMGFRFGKSLDYGNLGTIKNGNNIAEIARVKKSNMVIITLNYRSNVEFDFDELIKQYDYPAYKKIENKELVLKKSTEDADITLFLTNVLGKKIKGTNIKFEIAYGYLFIEWKK
jgi:Domain of unknown function (DUF4153)